MDITALPKPVYESDFRVLASCILQNTKYCISLEMLFWSYDFLVEIYFDNVSDQGGDIAYFQIIFGLDIFTICSLDTDWIWWLRFKRKIFHHWIPPLVGQQRSSTREEQGLNPSACAYKVTGTIPSSFEVGTCHIDEKRYVPHAQTPAILKTWLARN